MRHATIWAASHQQPPENPSHHPIYLLLSPQYLSQVTTSRILKGTSIYTSHTPHKTKQNKTKQNKTKQTRVKLVPADHSSKLSAPKSERAAGQALASLRQTAWDLELGILAAYKRGLYWEVGGACV
jgi:hypothetical protein